MIRGLIVATVLSGCFGEGPDDPNDHGVCGDGELDEFPGSNEDCDDGNQTNGDGCTAMCKPEVPVQLDWRITTLANETLACPAGFETAEVTATQHVYHACGAEPCDATELDLDEPALHAPTTFLFDCAAGQASISIAKPGLQVAHYISVRIKNQQTGEVFAESLRDRLDTNVEHRPSHHDIHPDAGFVRLEWELRQPNTAKTSCALAGVDQVHIAATLVGGGAAIAMDVPCGDHQTITAALQPGTYSFDVSSVPVNDVVVEPRGRLTELGLLVIQR